MLIFSRVRFTDFIVRSKEMNDIDMQKLFFHPVCNKQEIDRIFNVRNSEDYLLKLRAETIVDHMRLFRVYRNKALINENNWSLEKSFDLSHYKNVLSHLPTPLSDQCNKTTYGNIFSNDPNGMVFQTDYGPIITICDSLRFFLKFSHLTLLEFKCEVPMHVRMNALRIAIRVMLKTEALDFLMDPRGIVPDEVGKAIHDPIPMQLQFIAGHEFAHYILGHISDDRIITKPIYFAISSDDKDYKPMTVYNQSQKEEFEADIQAILLPIYDPITQKKILDSALLWFGSLDLYEAVCDAICPKNPWNYQTHPTARDRFDNLLTKIPTPPDFNLKDWKSFADGLNNIKDALVNDISVNIEGYERYGSAYLDKPNTEWRGPELVDRVDYY